MKFTSASANKFLKKLENEKDMLISYESRVRTFTAATIENIEDIRPEYDFEEFQKSIMELDETILKVKHGMNLFNTRTVLEGFNMTIDAALVYMSLLKSRITRYDIMSKTTPKKSYSYDDGLIVYTYTNYDPVLARKLLDSSQDELYRLQLALDKVNNTVEFEIEL